MRLRSRQASCRIGSTPFCSNIAAAASEPICERAPAPSVTLTASATPASGFALAMRSAGSHEAGGTISAVTANLPERRQSRSWFGRGGGTRVADLGIGSVAVYATVKQALARPVNASSLQRNGLWLVHDNEPIAKRV